FVESDGRLFLRAFRNDGYSNTDWYGWNQPVLSPCDCTVREIRLNPATNEPGILGKPPASAIELAAADGTRVTLVHIQDPVVREGDTVRAGQQLARVGNNGYSRSPHVHIGAWRDGGRCRSAGIRARSRSPDVAPVSPAPATPAAALHWPRRIRGRCCRRSPSAGPAPSPRATPWPIHAGRLRHTRCNRSAASHASASSANAGTAAAGRRPAPAVGRRRRGRPRGARTAPRPAA